MNVRMRTVSRARVCMDVCMCCDVNYVSVKSFVDYQICVRFCWLPGFLSDKQDFEPHAKHASQTHVCFVPLDKHGEASTPHTQMSANGGEASAPRYSYIARIIGERSRLVRAMRGGWRWRAARCKIR